MSQSHPDSALASESSADIQNTEMAFSTEVRSANTEISDDENSSSMAGKSQLLTMDPSTGAAKSMITSTSGVKTVGAELSSWKYTKGDLIKYQNGKTAFTVRKSLGCGAYGEVHLVYSEVQQKLRAMKCTKFGNMTPDQRLAMFKPMCEEALLMMELRHHPNIISLRFVKVSGTEFLMIMDVVDGSKELSEAYQDGTVWDPLCQDRNVSRVTSFLSMLWYQLARALDHLHGKLIMHCDVKPDNVMINPSTSHLLLMDMGLARRGKLEAGEFQVECGGCTPAYAGKLVNKVFNVVRDCRKDEMLKIEKIKKENPLSASSHDLLGSCLTMLAGLFGKWQSRKEKDAEGKEKMILGIWTTSGGPDALEKYWAAQELARTMSKQMPDWTHTELMQALKELIAKDAVRNKLQQAFALDESIDGKLLTSYKSNKELRTSIRQPNGKPIAVGTAKELWKQIRVHDAEPIDQKLYMVMKKCLSEDDSDCFKSARDLMIELLPLVGMELRSRIPLSVKEEVGENTVATVQINVGTAHFNRGNFELAKEMYTAVLSTDKDRGTALNGLVAVTCCNQSGIWKNPEHAVFMCEQGVKSAMVALDALETRDPSKAIQISQIYSILWALCHGNGQHADVVCENKSFFQQWSKTIDSCIGDGDWSLLASLCLGVGATVFANNRKQRTKLVQAEVPSKIIILLRKYPENAPILTQSLLLLNGLNDDPTLQRCQDIIQALEDALENWKQCHQNHKEVTCTVLETISSFVKYSAAALSQWGIPNVVSESLKLHYDCPEIQIQGSIFLESMRKANSHHRRGSILPTTQSSPLETKVLI